MQIKKNITLSKKQMRAIEIAKKATINSNCYHKHGAVLVNSGNRLINIANNNYDYCSFGERFNTYRYRNWFATRHAEIMACLNVPESLTDGATVFVVRVGSDGTLRNSKPCEMCQAVMKFLSIRRAIYSNETGGFDCMKL